MPPECPIIPARKLLTAQATSAGHAAWQLFSIGSRHRQRCARVPDHATRNLRTRSRRRVRLWVGCMVKMRLDKQPSREVDLERRLLPSQLSRSGKWTAVSLDWHLEESPFACALEQLAELLVAEEALSVVLDRVIALAGDAISGCDLASVTWMNEQMFETVAFSHPDALAIDEAQYADDRGPCLFAYRRREV